MSPRSARAPRPSCRCRSACRSDESDRRACRWQAALPPHRVPRPPVPATNSASGPQLRPLHRPRRRTPPCGPAANPRFPRERPIVRDRRRPARRRSRRRPLPARVLAASRLPAKTPSSRSSRRWRFAPAPQSSRRTRRRSHPRRRAPPIASLRRAPARSAPRPRGARTAAQPRVRHRDRARRALPRGGTESSRRTRRRTTLPRPPPPTKRELVHPGRATRPTRRAPSRQPAPQQPMPAEGATDAVRSCAQLQRATTRSLSWSSFLGPIPETRPRSSTVLNGPLDCRSATILAAVEGPTPGSVSS